MQVKVSIIGLMMGIAVFICTYPSTGLSSDVKEKAEFYKSCIVREIANCQSKTIMLQNSRSDKLREYAIIEAQKAAFFANEKERLINKLNKKNVTLKHYAVEYYLNKWFYGLNRR
jgi:hypothetical protein